MSTEACIWAMEERKKTSVLATAVLDADEFDDIQNFEYILFLHST